MRRFTDTVNVAIWARVSSRSQDTLNQLLELRKWADSKGWNVVHEFVTSASAWKHEHVERLNEAHLRGKRGEFQILLIWDLDRLSRGGAKETIDVVHRFANDGVKVLSYSQPWTDIPEGFRVVLLAFFGWMAEEESKKKSARVKLGLSRARSQGKQIGRRKGQKDRKPRAPGKYHLEQMNRAEKRGRDIWALMGLDEIEEEIIKIRQKGKRESGAANAALSQARLRAGLSPAEARKRMKEAALRVEGIAAVVS